jgi:hypothetical protein
MCVYDMFVPVCEFVCVCIYVCMYYVCVFACACVSNSCGTVKLKRA